MSLTKTEVIDWMVRFHWAWQLLASLGLGRGMSAAIVRYSHLSDDWALAIWLLSAGLFLWLLIFITTKYLRQIDQEPTSTQDSGKQATTLITSAAKFSTKQFFIQAYQSPLTEEAENNIRNVALANYPVAKDREDFYCKFIGIGIQTYTYDEIWWAIFRSQLLFLKGLNEKVLGLEQARSFYDAAEKAHSKEYAEVNETFDKWIGWLRHQMLVHQEGTNIAVTPRGRDFLKYLVHTGRSEASKSL